MRQLRIMPSLLCTAGLALACGCSAQVDPSTQAAAPAAVPAESSRAARSSLPAPPLGKPITAATLAPSRILAASYLEDTQRTDSRAAAPAPVVSRPVVSSAVNLSVPASTSALPARFEAPLDRTQQPSTIRLAMRPAPAADAPAPRPPVVQRASAANAPPVVAGPAAPLQASTVASDVDPSVIPADVAAEQAVQPVDRFAGRHARRESRSDVQPAASAGRPSPSALPDPPAVAPSNRRVAGDPLDVPLVERPATPSAGVAETPNDRSVLVRGRRSGPTAKGSRATPLGVTTEANPPATTPTTSAPPAESQRQSNRIEPTPTESAAPQTEPASRTKQTEPTVVGRLKLSSVAPPAPARAPQSVVEPPRAATPAPQQAAAPVLRSATPLAWTYESPQLSAPIHFNRPHQTAPTTVAAVTPAAPANRSVLVPRATPVSREAAAANVVPDKVSTVPAAPVKTAPVAAAPAYVAPVYVARLKVAKSSVLPSPVIAAPVIAPPTAPIVAPPIVTAQPVVTQPVAAQTKAPAAVAVPSMPAPALATDSGWIRARSASAPLPIVLAATPARAPVERPIERAAQAPIYDRQRAASIAAAAPAVTSPVAMASVQSSVNPADTAASPDSPSPNSLSPDSTSVVVPQRAVRGPSVPDPAEPQRSSTVSAVSHRVRQQVRYAFSLAGRGAVYSARVELIEALKLVALAQDADEGTSQHSQAVAAALMALREADDFATNDSQVNMQCDVARIVATHETPVLKGRVEPGTTALNALQDYYAYAQQQLAVAGGREVSSSMILYGLGRVYTAINNRQTMCGPKAIALFQAALSVDPRNYLAANEQGVLLARYGQLDESEALLQHSARVSPQPETWQNLATVHRLRGQVDMAAFDQQNAQELIAARRTGAAPNRAAAALVDWVDPGVFLAANEAPPPPSTTASTAGDKSTGPSTAAAAATSRAKSATSNVPNVAKPPAASSPWYVPQAIRDLTARSHDNTTTR